MPAETAATEPTQEDHMTDTPAAREATQLFAQATQWRAAS